jgi:hypothetical protein
MTNYVTVNGNTYNDGSVPPGNMANDGHRANLIPMFSDTVIELAAQVALAEDQVVLAADQVVLAADQVVLAAAQVSLAADQVALAADQVTLANAEALAAGVSATNALVSETNAAASAVTAINAPGTSATSVTSLTVGPGAQPLTIQTGKSLVAGMSVKIAYTTTPTIWMHGDITSYNSGTGALVVNVTTVNGSGTQAAWTVSLSAPAGVSTYPKRVVSTKTAAYSVLLSDHASIIRTTSGTGDLTLPLTTTATAGFYFTYSNETSATRYLLRAGSDTFTDGGTSASVAPGASVTVSCLVASGFGKWRVESISNTGVGAASLAMGSGVASGAGALAFGVNGTATASALGALSIGSGTANQSAAISLGTGLASGVSAINFGAGTSSGQDAVNIGNNLASGIRSFTSGVFGLADFYGKHAHGAQSPRGGVNGYSQYARTVLSASATATSTNYVLTADSTGTASASNIINVPQNRLVTFIATVSAGRLGTLGTEAAGWKVEGVIRRGNTGNVALVGTPTVTSLGGTVPTGWTLTATADATNQGLALTFNMGATAMGNVYCSATVHASEVAI